MNQILEQAISDGDFILGGERTRVTPADEEKEDSSLASPDDARPVTGQETHDELPDRYRKFLVDLRSRDRWPRREADGLARRHWLMLGDAIEKINGWAQARYETCLIYEEGNEILLEVSVLTVVF